MINQDELDDMKEDAERGHGIDNEKTLDLILDINRLNRIMPHTGGTCKHLKGDYCGSDFADEGLTCIKSVCTLHDEWELKD